MDVSASVAQAAVQFKKKRQVGEVVIEAQNELSLKTLNVEVHGLFLFSGFEGENPPVLCFLTEKNRRSPLPCVILLFVSYAILSPGILRERRGLLADLPFCWNGRSKRNETRKDMGLSNKGKCVAALGISSKNNEASGHHPVLVFAGTLLW